MDKCTNPDHVACRKELYDLIWSYREGTDKKLNDSKFRGTVYGYAQLLGYFKHELDQVVRTEIEEIKIDIEDIKNELGIERHKKIS